MLHAMVAFHRVKFVAMLVLALLVPALPTAVEAAEQDIHAPAPLVFVRGSTLWLYTPSCDTAARQLESKDWISPSSPVFLDSSGDTILFSAHRRERYGGNRGEINIDVANLYTWNGNRSTAVTDVGAICLASDPSPDCKDIVFVSNQHAHLRGLMPGTSSIELYVLSSPWKFPGRVTTDGGSKYNPRWSPDGSKIAYLWLQKDIAGIYTIEVKHPEQKPCLVAAAGDYPTWRPDGKAIAYTYRGKLYEADVPEFGCPLPSARPLLPASFHGFASFPRWTDYGIVFQWASEEKQGIALLDTKTDHVQILVSGEGEFGAADLAPRKGR